MARKHRSAIDPFGTSLLDMMTCSLGAVILVFVLKQALINGAAAQAKEQLRYQQTLTEINSNHLVQAEGWLKKKAEDLHRRAQGSIFGLPPLEGDVCILIDQSYSMDWFRFETIQDRNLNMFEEHPDIPAKSAKIARARTIVEAIIRNSPGIENVCVFTFARNMERVVDWTPIAADDSAVASANMETVVSAARNRIGMTRPYTDLIGAMILAIREMKARPHGGVIVLISDGEQENGEPVRPGIAETLSRIQEGVGSLDAASENRPVIVHCIGLIDQVGSWPPPSAFVEDCGIIQILNTLGNEKKSLGLVSDFDITQAIGKWRQQKDLEGAFRLLGASRDDAIRELDRVSVGDLGKLLSPLAKINNGVFIGLPVPVMED